MTRRNVRLTAGALLPVAGAFEWIAPFINKQPFALRAYQVGFAHPFPPGQAKERGTNPATLRLNDASRDLEATVDRTSVPCGQEGRPIAFRTDTWSHTNRRVKDVPAVTLPLTLGKRRNRFFGWLRMADFPKQRKGQSRQKSQPKAEQDRARNSSRLDDPHRTARSAMRPIRLHGIRCHYSDGTGPVHQ